MSKKMTIRGIGKKLELFTVPYGIITIILTFILRPLFNINFIQYSILLYIGIPLFILGIILHIISAVTMVKGFKKEILLATGMYSISRNPMYSTFIFLIIPGISLIINSWLVLTSSLVMFILFIIFIHEEEQYLEEKFGKEYINYKNKVGLLLPKIHSKKEKYL